MNKKQILKHLEKAESLDWDDLAYTIICLEKELRELQSSMNESQIKSFQQMIDIYEIEKQNLVNSMSKYWKIKGSDCITSLEDSLDY